MLEPFLPLKSTPAETILKVQGLLYDAYNKDKIPKRTYPQALRELIMFGEGSQYYLGSYNDEQVAVMALYTRRNENRALIEALAVDRRLRCQSLGSRALAELLHVAESEGATCVELASRRTTVAFYERNGFQPTKTGSDYVEMVKQIP